MMCLVLLFDTLFFDFMCIVCIILHNNLCIIIHIIIQNRMCKKIYGIIRIIVIMGKTIKIKIYWRNTNLQLNIKKTDTKDSLFPWNKDVCEIEGIIVGDTIILSRIKEDNTHES